MHLLGEVMLLLTQHRHRSAGHRVYFGGIPKYMEVAGTPLNESPSSIERRAPTVDKHCIRIMTTLEFPIRPDIALSEARQTKGRTDHASSPAAGLLSLPVLLGAVVAVCVFIFSATPMVDPDIGWHLRNAQYQLQTWQFLHRDLWAFTTIGAPWINHEWLAELPFYAGWHILGADGLAVVTLLELECIFLGVYLLSYRYARNAMAACLVTVAAVFLGTVSFGPRTLLAGWIALVIELLILQRYEQQRGRCLWALPPLFLLWINAHGSWMIGLSVLSAFCISGCFAMDLGAIQGTAWTKTERRQLATVFGLCVAALFVNPYGWHLVGYPFDLAFRQKLNIANVQEWQSLDFRSLRGRILIGACVLSLLSQLVRRRTWSPFALCLAAIGLYSAFNYSRFLFLAAILVLPLLATDFSKWMRPSSTRPRTLVNAAVLVAMLITGIQVHARRTGKFAAIEEQTFPIKALPYLASFKPVGRVFNDYNWGGYLEWHARSLPIFVDSRVDIFERSGAFADYLNAIQLKDTFAILDKYGIRYVLFRQDAPLIYLLRHSSDWKIDYEDETTILMERVPQPAQQSHAGE